MYFLELPYVGDYFAADIFALASLSVITPSDVEMIAIPRPFNTFGTSSAFTYARKPGLEIRFKFVITRSSFYHILGKHGLRLVCHLRCILRRG